MSFDAPRVCFAAPRIDRDLRQRRRKVAKGYWIARVGIRDMENERLRQYGGKLLVGSGTSRNVVIEFPSYQAAYDCWHSPEYQAAIAKRTPFAEGDVIIIEGYEGPQP